MCVCASRELEQTARGKRSAAENINIHLKTNIHSVIECSCTQTLFVSQSLSVYFHLLQYSAASVLLSMFHKY